MNKKTCILGIDPGFKGAAALVSDSYLKVIDLPLTKDYSGRPLICARAFSKFIEHYEPFIKLAVIEDVGVMPKNGAVGMFRFGYGAGLLFGVMRAHKIEVLKIRPSVWKPAIGLSRNKSESLSMAKSLWPDYKEFFRLKKHDGRAEAALLAKFAFEFL